MRFAFERTAEDYVLHIRTAKRFRRLLAEHPAHRVRNVTLSATVRAYDTGNTFFKTNRRFVGKRFEADELYFLQIQNVLLSCLYVIMRSIIFSL